MDFEIWMASAEASPWAQTGGLADVLRSLPAALAKSGTKVRRFLPGYGFIPKEEFDGERKKAQVPLGSGKMNVEFWTREEQPDLTTTLVVCPELFERDQIYGPAGGEYPDNAKRFTLFSRAIAQYVEMADRPPDVIHGHDWPTGLIPVLVRLLYGDAHRPRTVFSIHNLAYQGRFAASELAWLGVDPAIAAELFQPNGLEYYGDISFMKAALVYSDHIMTVSPTYAKDILTPEYGFGLEGVLRSRKQDLTGVLNGADDEVWNPSTDSWIPQTYNERRFVRAREAAQKELRKEFGLPLSKRPILGLVGRLADQKGMDIVIDASIPLLTLDTDLCILGDGDPAVADRLLRLHKHLPRRIGVSIGFEERLSHLLMAGSDILLVPSRYEPCGLTQIYALRYGTVPVVHRTGGLADTIVDFRQNRKNSTGFLFDRLTAHDLKKTVQEALEVRNKDIAEWRSLQERGMQKDFSWNESVKKYLAVYRGLLYPPVQERPRMREARV